MRGTIVGLAILAACQVSHAAAWISLGSNDEGEMLIDVGSIRPQGQYMKAWQMWKSNAPKQSRGVFPVEVFYSSSKALSLYDCKSERSATIQTVLYDDKEGSGKIVHATSIQDAQAAFTDPVPGTFGELLLRRVCFYKR